MFYFNDVGEFRAALTAIQSYNAPDIDSWTKQLGFLTLYGQYIAFENTIFESSTDLPIELSRSFFSVDDYGNIKLDGGFYFSVTEHSFDG